MLPGTNTKHSSGCNSLVFCTFSGSTIAMKNNHRVQQRRERRNLENLRRNGEVSKHIGENATAFSYFIIYILISRKHNMAPNNKNISIKAGLFSILLARKKGKKMEKVFLAESIYCKVFGQKKKKDN